MPTWNVLPSFPPLRPPQWPGRRLAMLVLLILLPGPAWAQAAQPPAEEGATDGASIRLVTTGPVEDTAELQLDFPLLYSSYLGGSGVDEGQAVAVNPQVRSISEEKSAPQTSSVRRGSPVATQTSS